MSRLTRLLEQRSVEIGIAALVFWSCAYFFQGGGWNQNAHFATTVALVDDGTLYLDRYRASTGDLAHAGEHVVSAKPIATALLAAPAYLLARALSWPIDNLGNAFIARAYLTSLFTSGLALTALALLLYRLLLRRLAARDAAMIAVATTIATPLWPASTMLTSHPLAALAALGAYAVLLTAPRPLSYPRLVAAGALAALPGALEYQLALLALPFGLYALWLCRPSWPRAFVMLAGALPVALLPLSHHLLVYGDPFTVGYSVLTDQRMAKDAATGFLGFDGFSLARLFELTFGTSRGFFFLSPFLVAALPGLPRLWRTARSEALVTGGIACLVLLVIACLTYWHSGSAVGSRYALVSVVFAAFAVGATIPEHRGWVALGVACAFAFMLLATSVTAIPPTPRAKPPYENVIGWYVERFEAGRVASWQTPVLVDAVLGDGKPTTRYAFNLGMLVGLPGRASLLPYLAALGLLGRWLWRRSEARS